MTDTDDEVIWYTNPGLEEKPVKEYLKWLITRDVKTIKTKSGSIKLGQFYAEKNAWWLRHPKLVVNNRLSEAHPANQALLDWDYALRQLLFMVDMDPRFYKKLLEMKEYSLLRTNMHVFQKHRANIPIILKLIQFPNDEFYTVRGIITKRQIDINPYSILNTILKAFSSSGIISEPHSIVVTKTQTHSRFLFPQTTRHLKDSTVVTFGVNIVASETCYTLPRVEMVIAFGDDDGMILHTPWIRGKVSYKGDTALLQDLAAQIVKIYSYAGLLENQLNCLLELPQYIVYSAGFASLNSKLRGILEEGVEAEDNLLDSIMTMSRLTKEADIDLEETRRLEQLAGRYI